MRIPGWQAGIPNLISDPETPKNLHRAGRHVIALDARRFACIPRLDHGHVDVTPSEVQGEGQADGAGADDQDRSS
jgi:hypothetical protein